jgi:hypothetical protein
VSMPVSNTSVFDADTSIPDAPEADTPDADTSIPDAPEADVSDKGVPIANILFFTTVTLAGIYLVLNRIKSLHRT